MDRDEVAKIIKLAEQTVGFDFCKKQLIDSIIIIDTILKLLIDIQTRHTNVSIKKLLSFIIRCLQQSIYNVNIGTKLYHNILNLIRILLCQ